MATLIAHEDNEVLERLMQGYLDQKAEAEEPLDGVIGADGQERQRNYVSVPQNDELKMEVIIRQHFQKQYSSSVQHGPSVMVWLYRIHTGDQCFCGAVLPSRFLIFAMSGWVMPLARSFLKSSSTSCAKILPPSNFASWFSV